MNTVVVGAIHRYGWEQVKHWWMSLKACGFEGEIHMLCYEVDERTRAQLVKRGVTVHECELTHPQVVISRFRDLAQVARQFGIDQWVVFADVGDLVFQRSPDEFLNGMQCKCKHIVTASEGVRFEGNRWMRQNLLDSFPEYYDMLLEREYYNAGSVAARAFEWTILAEEIYKMCIRKPMAVSHDQTAMNIILQTRQIAPVLFTGPQDGWCFSGASSMFAKTEDRANYRYAAGKVRGGQLSMPSPGNLVSVVPVMFHHYTRDRRVAAAVRQRVEDDFGNWRKR